MRLVAWTDGGGVSAGTEAYVGIVVMDDDTERTLWEHGACIGAVTHNEAEYSAVLAAIRYAIENRANRLLVRSDSVVVGQITGRFRVTKPHLAAPLEEVHRATEAVDFQIEWIPGRENKAADKLTWLQRDVRGREHLPRRQDRTCGAGTVRPADSAAEVEITRRPAPTTTE